MLSSDVGCAPVVALLPYCPETAWFGVKNETCHIHLDEETNKSALDSEKKGSWAKDLT